MQSLKVSSSTGEYAEILSDQEVKNILFKENTVSTSTPYSTQNASDDEENIPEFPPPVPAVAVVSPPPSPPAVPLPPANPSLEYCEEMQHVGCITSKKELQRRLSLIYNVREWRAMMPEDLEVIWDVQTNSCEILKQNALNLDVYRTTVELQTTDFKSLARLVAAIYDLCHTTHGVAQSYRESRGLWRPWVEERRKQILRKSILQQWRHHTELYFRVVCKTCEVLERKTEKGVMRKKTCSWCNNRLFLNVMGVHTNESVV